MDRRFSNPVLGFRQVIITFELAAGMLLAITWGAGTAAAQSAEQAAGAPTPAEAEGVVRVAEPNSLPGGGDLWLALQSEGEPPSLFDLPLEQLAQQPVFTAEPIVASASRREERASQAPATVIVLDQTDIRMRGYSQLRDVLRDLPGMETIDFYFSEFGTQVPVRGISGNNKIVVLINGMRVNPPGGENFPFRSDFSVRFAERIEIVYGSGSTLYGQDAISMVINVVTKKHTDELGAASGNGRTVGDLSGMSSAGGTTQTVELGAQAGFNFERQIWGWYSSYLDKCHEISVTGYVQYHDSELTALDRAYPAYWQAYKAVAETKTNGAGADPSRKDYGLNVFARVEGYNSSFQIWHRQSERSSAEGFNPNLGFLPEARWGDSSTVLEGKNTQHWCDDVSLESAITYSGYEIDPNSRYVFPDSTAPDKWFLNDSKYGRGSRIGLEETLRVELTERFSVLGGGLISHSDIIPKATFIGGYDPAVDPVAQGQFFTYTDGAGSHNIPQVSEVMFWTYAAYVEAHWQMREKLRIIGGVRVTKDDHYAEVPVTPRAALIYDLTDKVTAKYIYTQAFVAPAPYFAFATYDNGQLLATTNPNVAPETAQTHELNFTYHEEQVSLGLSLYHGTQGNIIMVSDRAAPQNIVEYPVFVKGTERTLVRTANGGDSRRYGADLYGKATFGSYSPWISYSYVDFEETNLGMLTGLPSISRHNGRVGVTWQASPKLSLTPSCMVRSDPENVTPGALTSELQTPYELNLYILYRRSERLDLFADLRNITDHRYALGGFTGTAIPQETFRGVAGLRLTY